jgi:hypothetical protein
MPVVMTTQVEAFASGPHRGPFLIGSKIAMIISVQQKEIAKGL